MQSPLAISVTLLLALVATTKTLHLCTYTPGSVSKTVKCTEVPEYNSVPQSGYGNQPRYFLIPQNYGPPLSSPSYGPPPAYGPPSPPPPPDYQSQLQDLYTILRTGMTDMGTIATDENIRIGSQIVAKITADIASAAKLIADYNILRVFKRQVGTGDETMNKVGQILVESNDKLALEKGSLSSATQEKIDNRHDKAVSECKAEVCLSHAEKRRRIKEAKAARAG